MSEEEAAAGRAEAEVAERLREPRYTGALSLLCDEAGFLVDTKVRAGWGGWRGALRARYM